MGLRLGSKPFRGQFEIGVRFGSESVWELGLNSRLFRVQFEVCVELVSGVDLETISGSI